MANRVLQETLLTPAEASKRFPSHQRGCKTVCPGTIRYWMKTGLKLSDGRVFKLEYARVGKGVFTSEEAIQRFLSAQQDTTEVA